MQSVYSIIKLWSFRKHLSYQAQEIWFVLEKWSWARRLNHALIQRQAKVREGRQKGGKQSDRTQKGISP